MPAHGGRCTSPGWAYTSGVSSSPSRWTWSERRRPDRLRSDPAAPLAASHAPRRPQVHVLADDAAVPLAQDSVSARTRPRPHPGGASRCGRAQVAKLCCFARRRYRHTSYHKQTKNQWARDDPAFVVVCCVLVALAATAYCIT
jgi:hypothetical protein